MRQQTSKCYRTVCTNEHDGCLHSQMKTLYCEQCAVLINRNNEQVPNLVIIPRKCAVQLEKINNIFNHGRGVCCIRTTIVYLTAKKIEEAMATIGSEWDKISSYPEIVKYLKDTNLADKTWYTK